MIFVLAFLTVIGPFLFCSPLTGGRENPLKNTVHVLDGFRFDISGAGGFLKMFFHGQNLRFRASEEGYWKDF